MSPPNVDPKVNYRRLGVLSKELTDFWTRMQAMYLDAMAGFALIRQSVDAQQAQARAYMRGTDLDSEEFQDSRMFSYGQIFSSDFCTSSIHKSTQGAAKARNSPDGTNVTTLGQLCVVGLYAFWNDYLRKEYVIAKGELDPQEPNRKVRDKQLRIHASHDFWGDLGYLRNSIVHNQGIASSDVRKCKVIHWFKPGDFIAIDTARMRAILLGVLRFRNELSAEQRPKHYIRIESRS